MTRPMKPAPSFPVAFKDAGQVQLQVHEVRRRIAMHESRRQKSCSDSELYLPTCWRIAVLFLMTCAAGLTVRLAVLHTPRTDRSELGDWQQALLSGNTSGFFLDIGASGYSIGGSISTRYLESRGWRGVCADPFPQDLESRQCKLVKLPVGAKSGSKVNITDCTDQSQVNIAGLTRLVSHLVQGSAACPKAERNTVGVLDLLELAAAPRVIEYASLDTDGSELEILQAFPFERSCVRAWQVKHGFQEHIMKGVRDVLEPQHCHIKDGFAEFFIRCPCDPASLAEAERRGRSARAAENWASSKKALIRRSSRKNRGGGALVPR